MSIDAYIGKSGRFDDALGEFAVGSAQQTVVDHARLVAAANNGEIVAQFA